MIIQRLRIGWALIATILLLISQWAHSSPTPINGDKLIDLTLEQVDGSTVSLSSIAKGKLVLMNLWATRCSHCISTIPTILSFLDKIEASNQIVVLHLSIDDDRSLWVKAIDERFHGRGIHLRSPGYWRSEAALRYGIGPIPRVIVFGKDGTILEVDAPGLGTPELETQISEWQ
jgi:thiol-disulfide isomerase/thioredoxin